MQQQDASSRNGKRGGVWSRRGTAAAAAEASSAVCTPPGHCASANGHVQKVARLEGQLLQRFLVVLTQPRAVHLAHLQGAG